MRFDIIAEKKGGELNVRVVNVENSGTIPQHACLRAVSIIEAMFTNAIRIVDQQAALVYPFALAIMPHVVAKDKVKFQIARLYMVPRKAPPAPPPTPATLCQAASPNKNKRNHDTVSCPAQPEPKKSKFQPSHLAFRQDFGALIPTFKSDIEQALGAVACKTTAPTFFDVVIDIVGQEVGVDVQTKSASITTNNDIHSLIDQRLQEAMLNAKVKAQLLTVVEFAKLPRGDFRFSFTAAPCWSLSPPGYIVLDRIHTATSESAFPPSPATKAYVSRDQLLAVGKLSGFSPAVTCRTTSGERRVVIKERKGNFTINTDKRKEKFSSTDVESLDFICRVRDGQANITNCKIHGYHGAVIDMKQRELVSFHVTDHVISQKDFSASGFLVLVCQAKAGHTIILSLPIVCNQAEEPAITETHVDFVTTASAMFGDTVYLLNGEQHTVFRVSKSRSGSSISWCSTARTTGVPVPHNLLRLSGITADEKYVYVVNSKAINVLDKSTLRCLGFFAAEPNAYVAAALGGLFVSSGKGTHFLTFHDQDLQLDA